MNLKVLSRWQYAIFLIYIILLCIIIPKHEPWFDEAQAWLIARDSSLHDLLVKLLRYEGSPGLWHLLLMPPAKIGLPYLTLNIISGIIAIGSTYLFLRYSPFPFYVKILYPFSYFAFYQYAVVARSYVLLPLILFMIAMNYEGKLQHPYRFVFLLILLSNISLHGFIIAIGLGVVYFFSFIQSISNIEKTNKVKHIVAFSTFGFMVFLTVLELKPASDLITVAYFRRDISNFFNSTQWMLSDSLTTNISASVNGKEWLYTISQVVFRFIFILTLFWLIIRKRLIVFLIPLAGLGALFTAVYANVWHQGTLFYLWLFTLWISFNGNAFKDRLTRITKPVMAMSLFLVLSIHLYWSYNAFMNDYKYNYSASREAADYIKVNKLQDKEIYMTSFHSAAVLPYFSTNIFCNFNHKKKPCYWLWSGKNNMYREPYLNLSRYQPDYILMGVKGYCQKRIYLDLSMLPSVPGYRVIRYFNGSLYWKERPFETDSFALFEKISH